MCVLALLSALFAAVPARADEARPRLVLVQPLSGLAGPTATWEQAFAERWSWSLGLALQSMRAGLPIVSTGNEPPASTTLSVSLNPGVSCFLGGTAPEGPWVGVRAQLAFSRTRQDGASAASVGTDALGGSVLFGYTAVVGPGLAFQAGVGLGATSGRNVLGAAGSGGGLGGLGGLGVLTAPAFSAGLCTTLGLGWAF